MLHGARASHLQTFTKLFMLFTSGLMVLLILAHGGAVTIGQWQGDDYDYAAGLRDRGLGFAAHRLLTDAPRPFSEFLIFFYAWPVDRLRRPLIGTFLSLCWAIFQSGS